MTSTVANLVIAAVSICLRQVLSIHTSTSILANRMGFMPPVRHYITHDATPCVAVGLSGLHGAGREMKLHQAVWQNVSTIISPWWQVTKSGKSEYVSCCCIEALAIAKRTSKVHALFLSRYLIDPAPGLFVWCLDGDPLNLVRSNLVVVDRTTHSRANVAAMREARLRRYAEAAARVVEASR